MYRIIATMCQNIFFHFLKVAESGLCKNRTDALRVFNTCFVAFLADAVNKCFRSGCAQMLRQADHRQFYFV